MNGGVYIGGVYILACMVGCILVRMEGYIIVGIGVYVGGVYISMHGHKHCSRCVNCKQVVYSLGTCLQFFSLIMYVHLSI